MRLLKKLILKFVVMVITVALLGAVMRLAKPYIMKSAGMPEGMPGAESLADARFSSDESDLMATVLKSAVRFVSGSAKRDEVAGELSDKLYANRPGAAHMSELGIELEKPGGKSSGAAPANSISPGQPVAQSSGKLDAGPAEPGNLVIVQAAPGASLPAPQPAAKTAAQSGAPAGVSPEKPVANDARDALLGRIWAKAQTNPELSLVPVVLVGMLVVQTIRRRRSPAEDFLLPDLSKVLEAESGPYDMQHPVHSLPAEEFEMLVALVYQRQGYRVTMPAGLGSGRGGDFTVQRKSERLLVQCRRSRPGDEVSVERVRELYDAALAAGVTRGAYVASGGFSWDARNFAKAKGVTVVNARILDGLLSQALPDGEVLAVSQWAPKLMSKVKLTPPLCPACEAPMDEVTSSAGSAWLCSQRPDCRGRRGARKSATLLSTAVTIAAPAAKPIAAPKPVTATKAVATAPPPRKDVPPAATAPTQVTQRRARTIVPAAA